MPTRKNAAVGAEIIAVAACLGALSWRFSKPRASDHVVLSGNVDVQQVLLAVNASERIAQLLVQVGGQVRAGLAAGRLDNITLTLLEPQGRARSSALPVAGSPEIQR